MSAGEVDYIERILGRVKRVGFLPLVTANSMADAALFAAVIRDRDHVLRTFFFSERPVSKYSLIYAPASST